MILVDTSVWVDHLRFGDEALAGLLETGRVLVHPFVIGELALGNLRQRHVILGYLRDLPQVAVASSGEVLQFIERHDLAGLGIGYVDAHLLATTQLTPGCPFGRATSACRPLRNNWVSPANSLRAKRIIGSSAITASVTAETIKTDAAHRYHHNRSWTPSCAPGVSVNAPAPAQGRAGHTEPQIVVPVVGIFR